MKKIKVYLFVIIAAIIGYCMGATLSTAYADNHSVTNTQGVTNVQGVSYDYVYVNGTRYIVFMSTTGDIEVVK